MGESTDPITELLQDYHHLITAHQHEFEAIYNDISAYLNSTPCNIANCMMMKRNHRDRSNANSEKRRKQRKMYTNYKDHREVITQQFMDQIHVYILHTFDAGFALTKQEKLELDAIASPNNAS